MFCQQLILLLTFIWLVFILFYLSFLSLLHFVFPPFPPNQNSLRPSTATTTTTKMSFSTFYLHLLPHPSTSHSLHTVWKSPRHLRAYRHCRPHHSRQGRAVQADRLVSSVRTDLQGMDQPGVRLLLSVSHRPSRMASMIDLHRWRPRPHPCQHPRRRSNTLKSRKIWTKRSMAGPADHWEAFRKRLKSLSTLLTWKASRSAQQRSTIRSLPHSGFRTGSDTTVTEICQLMLRKKILVWI